MIAKYVLKNFQSHKNTLLAFHPGINVLTGESRTGKSALVRGLELVARNRRSTTSYFSNFAGPKNTTVSKVLLSGGEIVGFQKRIRIDKNGKKKPVWQKYEVTKNGVCRPYMGFKTTVPIEVSETLNLTPLNFQFQLDIPFIIDSSGTEIARLVNNITGLEKATRLQSAIEARVKASETTLTSVKASISTCKEELRKYKGLEAVENKIQELDGFVEKSSRLETALRRLKESQRVIATSRSKVRFLNESLNKLQYYKSRIEELDSWDLRDKIRHGKLFLEYTSNLQTQRDNLQKVRSQYLKLLTKSKRCPVCFSTNINLKLVKEALK